MKFDSCNDFTSIIKTNLFIFQDLQIRIWLKVDTKCIYAAIANKQDGSQDRYEHRKTVARISIELRRLTRRQL